MSSPVKVLESIIAFLQSKAQKEPVVTGLYALGEGENSATPAKRQKANDAAVALLRKLQENGSTKATDEQKRTLSQYTGTGGNLMDEEGLKGSPYEYYTPVPVAKAMWDLLAEYGVGSASKVLDPSSGTGIFATTAPAGTLMHSIELSDVSGNINRLVNDSPTHSVTVSPFEQVAANTDDETFDTVITNVPFGTNSSRGKNKQLDAKYQGDSLEVYFILRSLDKLKPGGLAMFITPAKIMSSGSFSKFRQQLCRRAELLGAYRLPNKVFSATGADVTTDIIVLKKYGREAGRQILDLYSSGNIDLLTESRVMDTDIIKGQYFKHEGKKFLLGEVEEGKGRFGMVERVVNNQSLANILSLVRKFPDSRINWSMLNTVNADLPDYRDGDQQVMDGMTFEHQQGQWVQVESAQERVDESLQENPFSAYVNNITREDLQAASAQRTAMGKKTEAWKVQLLEQAKTNADCQYWLILASIQDVLEKDATKESYAERFPVLTASMRGIADTYNRASIKPVNKWARDIVKRVAIAFDKSGDQGISAYWMDGTHAINDIESSHASSAKAAYDRLLYTGAANQFGVAIEDLRKVYPDFDVKKNTEFCLFGDSGRVMLARDYYVGNCQSLLDQIEQQLAVTNDPELRMKLLEQKQEATKRIPRQDVRGMSFDLRSTMVPLALKAEFLRQFGDPAVQLSGVEGEDAKLIMAGEKPETLGTIIGHINRGYSGSLDKYLVNRILDALNNNGNLSLRVGKSSDVRKEDHDKVFALLKRKYQDLNLVFDAWLKSDPVYIADLDLKVNSPSLKMFSPELDNSPIVIDGFNPKLQGFKGLNGYQNEEIRRQTRRMEGICGFDVGLGKTLTALAAIQNMHNMGVKKRTFIVVPNHTISKWARDAKMAYDSVDDMLVIGSNGNQQEKVDSSFYINDFNSLLKKPYRKVIMTADAFTMIPMRENTLSKYFDNKSNDGRKATAIALEDTLSKVIKRLNVAEGRMPYFEELGVDSLVFDEAQLFKNGKTTEGKFARIRGLSLLAGDALSARALSAAVKADYVRGGNSERDGVMLLTATPFTNSPAEILTMLSLSVGDREALNMLGGESLSSVDDFLSCYANISEIEATTVAGLVTSIDTFTGFKNVAMLKKAIHGVANIQTAKERGLRIPDQDDQTVSVTLNQRDQASLNMLKQAYLQAKEAKENGMADTEILEKVMRLTGESAELLGHPFNLIARMSDVIVMGADMGMTRTIILSYDEAQETQVTNLVTKFNAKKFKIKTSRNFPSVEPRDVLKVESKKGDDIRDDGEGGSIYTIQASAKILDNRIIINVDDSGILGRFMGMANDMNVIINPVLSSKVLAMLDNVKAELAMPKTASRAKQLIFCDMLPLHHLIKAALVQQCGIPSSEIAIINAQTMPDGTPGTPSTSEVQFVQDQFKDDAFTIVIANRKAETGIDLQHGTQAIHHLTTGWTPDSITQRNGRGVRQGNKLDKVSVYLYKADGTFDEYKQNLIDSKADWIDTLTSKDDYAGGTLNVSRELSKQDYEDLINADSPEAVNKIIQARKEREEQERLARNKAEVTRRIAAYKAAAAVVSKNEDSESLLSKFASDDLATYSGLTSRQRKSKSQDEMNKIQDDIDALLMPWKMISETAASRFSSLAHDNRPGSFYALTGMRANNWLNQKDAANNPIFNRMNMRKQQAINMAEEMRRSFMTFEDSGLSVEDRALSLAGRLVEVNGELYRHGDLIKVNGARYSIALVSNYKVTDFSGYTTGIQKIDPSEHDQAAQELVDSDVNKLKNYKYSTVEDAVRDYSSINLYCLERPELVTLVNEKLGAIRKSEDEREYAFNLSGFQIQDQPYWPDTSESDAIGFINLPENQSLRKQYNATFTDNMLRIEGKQMIFSGATKRKLGINSLYVGSLPSSLLSNITKWCEAREEEFSISPEHAVSVLKLWDEMRRFLRDIKSPSYAAMLSSIGVSQDAITKEDLPKIYRATLDEVIPQVKNRQEIHGYLVKTGAYDDAMVNVVMLAGQSKWTPYVRNGRVAVKSLFDFNHSRNFIKIYKEDIKAKAKSMTAGYASFRGDDKAWIYSVPLMEWIAQQTWYDESAIDFLPA